MGCSGRSRHSRRVSLPARADELAQNVGPVGPHEAILTEVGNKRRIAFYEPDGVKCGLNVVMWDSADEAVTRRLASAFA